MIFYQKNQIDRILSYVQDSMYLEISLHWKERLTHPLSGTTKKKDYQTKVKLVKFRNLTDPIEIRNVTFDFWVIPESIYAMNVQPLTLLFLYGKDDFFAQNPSMGLFIENKKEFYQFEDIERILDDVKFFYPSPEKNWIIASKNHQTYILNYQKENQYVEVFKVLDLELIDRYSITWDSKVMDKFFFRTQDEIYEYQISNEKLQKAKLFPECFYPPTSFGTNFDDSGNFREFDRENQRYVIRDYPKKNFYQKQYTHQVNAVRYQCF